MDFFYRLHCVCKGCNTSNLFAFMGLCRLFMAIVSLKKVLVYIMAQETVPMAIGSYRLAH